MPELPEVETVKRILTEKISGQRIISADILYPRSLATDRSVFLQGIERCHPHITSFSRKGKFLIAELSNKAKLIFHLRMEGKLFVHDKEGFSPSKHTRAVFTLDSCILTFDDVRKFGRIWYYPEGEDPACLKDVGPDALNLDPEYVFEKMKNCHKPVKEFLTDQSLIAGIGNIYADEICFSCRLNPFAPAMDQADETVAENIAREAERILRASIANNGSTIHSYKAAENVSGNFQSFLKVYGREGEKCEVCKTPIMKRFLKGRGTSFCPQCQHIPAIIGVCGGIASGKSEICRFISEHGYRYISCDEMAKKLYEDPLLKKSLTSIAPEMFDPEGAVIKPKLKEALTSDRKLRRRWLAATWSRLKDEINELLNQQPGQRFVIEAPLLFQAHLDSLCRYKFIAVAADPISHLRSRHDPDPEKSLRFGNTNQWEKYVPECDAVIHTDDTLASLAAEVDSCLIKFGLE